MNSSTDFAVAEASFKWRSRLVIQPQKDRIQWTVEAGDNLVLTLNQVLTADQLGKPNTTARTVSTLALEIVPDVPRGKAVDASSYVITAVYQFGAHFLQFAALQFSGDLLLSESDDPTSIHGWVDMKFVRPIVSKPLAPSAHVKMKF